MILQRGRPIDLDLLASSFLAFVELRYLDLAPGESLFDARFHAERERAVADYIRYIDDRYDEEPRYRDALAWTLNLTDDRFAAVLAKLKVPFPTQRDPHAIRRFLLLLWDRTHADWRVLGFESDAYELVGP